MHIGICHTQGIWNGLLQSCITSPIAFHGRILFSSSDLWSGDIGHDREHVRTSSDSCPLLGLYKSRNRYQATWVNNIHGSVVIRQYLAVASSYIYRELNINKGRLERANHLAAIIFPISTNEWCSEVVLAKQACLMGEWFMILLDCYSQNRMLVGRSVSSSGVTGTMVASAFDKCEKQTKMPI